LLCGVVAVKGQSDGEMFRLAARAAPRGRTAPVVVEGSKGVHSPAARLTVSMPPPRTDAPLVYVNQESDVGSPVTGWRCPSSLSPCRNRRQRETERAHLAAHFPIFPIRRLLLACDGSGRVLRSLLARPTANATRSTQLVPVLSGVVIQNGRSKEASWRCQEEGGCCSHLVKEKAEDVAPIS